MNNFLKLAALALAFTVGAAAQECSVSFTLTADGSSGQYLNLTGGCTFWAITYSNTGFSALDLTFESAPNSGGVAGTWVPFAGSTESGVNPNTAITQGSSTFSGYYPFLRATLSNSMGSGTVKGTFYGWRERPQAGGNVPDPLSVKGCGAAGAAPACDPVLIAGVDNVGVVAIPLLNPDGAATASLKVSGTAGAAQYETDFSCASQTPIALTASGLTQIVALTAAQAIRVCHVSLSGDGVVNLKFSTGTGSNCGTGTTDLTGLYYGINSLALDFSNHAALRVPSAQALCVSLSGAANWGGVVIFGKF